MRAAIAAGLEKYAGQAAGVMFAIALIDACHHRRLRGVAVDGLCDRRRVLAAPLAAPQGHATRRASTPSTSGLIALAAALVLTPGAPLGLLTNAVQTLAGVLLPSATVFLLLLCNDKPVLGPWVNSRWLNLFTGAVIAVLVLLSIILTASVLFPDATNEQVILGILVGGGSVGLIIACDSDDPRPARRAGDWREAPGRH